MRREEISVPSTDGIHSLSGVIFLPEGEIKGYFHVVHGMTEYVGRYEGLLSRMAEEGFVAFGYDHLGHGRTAASAEELGFIAPKDGWRYLLSDVGAFYNAVRQRFGADLPYYLLGHSMGSFVVRLAVSEGIVAPRRLLVMGTGGANPVSGMGICLASLIGRLYGARHISPFMDKLAFGGYNKGFSDTDAPNPWLTTDREIRSRYAADPFCSYKFTVSAMKDLITLTHRANSSSAFRSFPKDVPVLLLSGKEDVVGGYGKGVEKVAAAFRKAGALVQTVLYEGARHEILNDFTRDAVIADILTYING